MHIMVAPFETMLYCSAGDTLYVEYNLFGHQETFSMLVVKASRYRGTMIMAGIGWIDIFPVESLDEVPDLNPFGV